MLGSAVFYKTVKHLIISVTMASNNSADVENSKGKKKLQLTDIVPSIFGSQFRPAVPNPVAHTSRQQPTAALRAFKESFLVPSFFAQTSQHPLSETASVDSTLLPAHSLQSLQSRIIPEKEVQSQDKLDSLTQKDFFTEKKTRKQYESTKRLKNANTVLHKKQHAALSASIADVKKTACCLNHCCGKFTQAGMLDVRTRFWGSAEFPSKSEEQKTTVSNDLVRWLTVDKITVYNFRYFFQSTQICAKAYEALLPISHSRLCAVREDIRNTSKSRKCLYVYPSRLF